MLEVEIFFHENDWGVSQLCCNIMWGRWLCPLQSQIARCPYWVEIEKKELQNNMWKMTKINYWIFLKNDDKEHNAYKKYIITMQKRKE
jgi:hypothetical protein